MWNEIFARHGRYNHINTLKSIGQQSGVFSALSQEATFGTGTVDISDKIAGLVLYNQVNMNNPVIGALPEIDRTGDESINLDTDTPATTYRAIFNPPAISGVAGGGSLPTAVTWDTRRVVADIQISSMAIETDFIIDIENRLGHDTLGLEDLLEVAPDFMTRSVERDALMRAVNASGGTAGDTPAYENDDLLLLLDRAIASEDEETNADDPNNDPYVAGDLDVYDITRANTADGESNESNWADAQVDHNSGTDRQLTSDLINTWIDNQVDNSSAEYENLIIITGRDSARVMSDLRESQFRGDALREPGREDVNDAESRWGLNFTARISHWDGIPVVVAPTVPSDSLSRVFALDTTPGQVSDDSGNPLPKIGIENYRTPDTWRAGPDQPVNPIATGEIKAEAAFAMYHELVVRDFGAQGKLRDISET